ncbi:MAG TPA: FecR domain-containing protein [Caulobacteraceae bacterium]
MSAPEIPVLIEEAAEWFALKRSGAMGAEDLQALQVWLSKSPDHAAAWQEVAGAWDVAGAVRSDPEILRLREQARRVRPKGMRAAIAASLAVAVLGGWSALGSGGYVPAPTILTGGEQTFRTGVGQTATVRLRDGSLVTLDTDSVVKARETDHRRMLRLAKGQAYFKVAKDKSRPFTVAAGDKLVTATGTAFSVRVGQKAVEVTLVEGHVRVEEAAKPVALARTTPRFSEATEMKAGSKLVAGEDRHWALDKVDTRKATSWMAGQLIFEDRPLAEAAAELNRYSSKKIVIKDPDIAGSRIVSVVKAGDVDAFVRVVTSAGFARVVSDDDDTVELAAPEKNIAVAGA